jgi:hypothetical protein
MSEPIDLTLPCARQSLAAGEPIVGSATASVRCWLLIEHRGRWERDIASTDMPAATHAWLGGLLSKHKRLRPQLIRQNGAEGPLRIYVVTTGRQARVRRFVIDSHDMLPDLGIEPLIEGTGDAGGPGPESLYLVCTHGRRDQCCARHGVAFHKTLAELPEVDGEVWQTSHLGGHRFAATAVYLPSGVQYGRLLPEEAEMLVKAHLEGEVYAMNRYRGHTRLAPPVQTGEAFLRQELGQFALGGVEPLGHELVDKASDRWAARFRANHQIHRLVLEPRTGVTRRKSCDAAEAEASPARWYYVVRHEAQTF